MDRGAVLVAVLAAGRATRFGGGKLDAPCAGRAVGRWVLEAVEAAGLAPGICVTGPVAPRFLEGARGWERVINPRPEDGLSGSLALAAGEAQARGSGALLVVLADMPLVSADLLARLVAQDGAAAVDHAGRPGVPTLIPSFLLPAILEARGDRGAAALLARLSELVLLAAETDELLDVDTAEDLERAEAILDAGRKR